MVEMRRRAGVRTEFSCAALDMASLHTWGPVKTLVSTKRKELSFFSISARTSSSLFSALKQMILEREEALAYCRSEVQI